MMRPKGRVLVLGGDTRSFLTVVRSLGRAGVEVHVAWCALSSPALKSRYISRCHMLPDYRPDDDRWLSAFNQLIRDEAFDLILPCTDGTILPLQMCRGALESSHSVHLLPDDVYGTCASKSETYVLAKKLGVPLPAQIVAKSLDEVYAAAGAFGYPLILKPDTSSTRANPLKRQAVHRVECAADVPTYANPILKHGGSLLVQQYFSGTGTGVEVLCKDGQILTAFQHERIHEPLKGGGSSYRRSVPLNPEMLEATHRLMAELRYTGVAMVEFKQNPQTGGWVLIEINARFWGSLPLSVAAGLDFPLYLYEMLCEGRTEFPQKYRVNVYARNWGIDLQWLLDNVRATDAERDSALPMWRVAAEIRHVLAMRERSDTFVWDDPKPAGADVGMFFSQMTFAVAKRIAILRQMASRRALAALRNKQRILFVCHGNICRSPFAAAAMKRIVPNAEVSSSGYFPKRMRQSPEEAVEAARQMGIDLAAHRSNVLEQRDVDRAEVIFVFERQNADALEARFANVASKIHLLGSLDPAGPLEIDDPYGGPVEEFLKCYERIARIVEDLGPRVSVPVPAAADASRLVAP